MTRITGLSYWPLIQPASGPGGMPRFLATAPDTPPSCRKSLARLLQSHRDRPRQRTARFVQTTDDDAGEVNYTRVPPWHRPRRSSGVVKRRLCAEGPPVLRGFREPLGGCAGHVGGGEVVTGATSVRVPLGKGTTTTYADSPTVTGSVHLRAQVGISRRLRDRQFSESVQQATTVDGIWELFTAPQYRPDGSGLPGSA